MPDDRRGPTKIVFIRSDYAKSDEILVPHGATIGLNDAQGPNSVVVAIPHLTTVISWDAGRVTGWTINGFACSAPQWWRLVQ
jgi:hypothetical protein